MKIIKPYPYLYRDKDRQGAKRWRLRAPGRRTVTMEPLYGSPEFSANYRAALEGEQAGWARTVVPSGKYGTFDALGRSYLRSADFSRLAWETQRKRRYLVEQFLDRFGELRIAGLKRSHVRLIMEQHAATPGTARNVLSMLRVLLALAIEDGIRDDDPTVGIKRPKLSRDGWHCWTDAEIGQYEERIPSDRKPALPSPSLSIPGNEPPISLSWASSTSETARSAWHSTRLGFAYGCQCTRS